MNKLLLAIVAGLLTVGAVDAGCHKRRCGQPKRACATRAARCEPTPPKCYKCIEVPVTVMEKRRIEVPANRIEIAQPDKCIKTPQPAKEIRVPLPQQYRIEYECVPDVVTYEKCAPLVRYECPADCQVRR